MSMYQLPFELIRVIFKLNEEFWILSSNSIISLKSIHAIPKPRKYTDRVTLTIYLPRRRYEKYTFYYMFYYNEESCSWKIFTFPVHSFCGYFYTQTFQYL